MDIAPLRIHSSFYRMTRMHSADYAVARCLSVRPSVCLSHASIVYKRLQVWCNLQVTLCDPYVSALSVIYYNKGAI